MKLVSGQPLESLKRLHQVVLSVKLCPELYHNARSSSENLIWLNSERGETRGKSGGFCSSWAIESEEEPRWPANGRQPRFNPGRAQSISLLAGDTMVLAGTDSWALHHQFWP
jgi:hypothetical protein